MNFTGETIAKLQGEGYVFVPTDDGNADLKYYGDHMMAEASIVTHFPANPHVTITRMDGVEPDFLLEREFSPDIEPEQLLREVAAVVDALDSGLNDAYSAMKLLA